MRTIVIHTLFIGLVVGMGILSGVGNAPGDWYAGLEKPFFNPPPWVFAPVWTVLYVMIGIAGARIWLAAPASSAMQIWFGQLVLNLMWSPTFFGLENPVLGLLVIVCLLAAIAAFIFAARHRDRAACLLFVPYAAWVGFATALNLAIVLMN